VVTIGSAIAPNDASNQVFASGAANTITINAATAGNNIVTASGAGDTITITGKGGNTITANGAGDTITVGDSTNGVGANTITAMGAGDTVTFLGTQVGVATATVGNNANVTFGTTTNSATETVTVTGDLTGDTSSGSVAMTTLNNVLLSSGDKLMFLNATAEDSAVTSNFGGSLVNVASATTLGQALDLAIGQDANTTSSKGVLDWFQFSGNTYIAESINGATAPTAHAALSATDAVVKISGLVDLSTSSFSSNTHVLTFGAAV
jgi:hypothetical protein